MKNNLYIIRALTNMHVGSGENNLGIVDNLIQRDSITNIPVINSSSLKGAFREFFRNNKSDNKDIDIDYIFGSDVKNKQKHQAGSCKFFDAALLAMPVRSDKAPYMMVTCPMLLNNFLQLAQLFEIKSSFLHIIENLKKTSCPGKFITFNKSDENAYLEDLETTTSLSQINIPIDELKKLFGDAPLVVVPDDIFVILCGNDHLPILSRNCLDNGISKSLFFEQVLPRESVLYFMLLTPETLNESFQHELVSNVFQIGAGATIGEGYCALNLFNDIKLQGYVNK